MSSRGVLLDIALWWSDYPSAGLGRPGPGGRHRRGSRPRARRPGAGPAELVGVGDVRAASRFGWAAEQHTAVAVRENHGFDGVPLVFAGDERLTVLASGGRRTRISFPSMIPVFPSAPKWSMTSVRVRRRTPGPTVHPASARSGRTSPMGRVRAERSTPNQQASTSCVTPCRRCTRVARSRSTNTSRCSAQAPIARFRGLDTSLTWGRSCHNVPSTAHEFSEHFGRQVRDPPVTDDLCTRRILHHTTMIDDQEIDASPPTVHKLARCACRRSGRSAGLIHASGSTCLAH
ncbi:hypothetical protein SUDANB66_06533 (plasmid) [Streptomyces sp. SudanB66_2053]